MTRSSDFAKLRVASWLFPILLLYAAPALACTDGEYSVLNYTKGDKYELDKKALKLDTKKGDPVLVLPGGCFDCNDKGPYAERKTDLDAKKRQLRQLRKNAEDEGKAALQKKFNDARARYNDARYNTKLDSRVEEERKKAVDELNAAKAALDAARNDLQKFQAMIEAIKREMASLQRQTSELNQARSSCSKPCPPDSAMQCR